MPRLPAAGRQDPGHRCWRQDDPHMERHL